MGSKDIRIFDVQRSRDGDITYAIVCDGRTHFVCNDSLKVEPRKYAGNKRCNNLGCRANGSQSLDVAALDYQNQVNLELTLRVPHGLVLVDIARKDYNGYSVHKAYSAGQDAVLKAHDDGTFLADGDGLVVVNETYGFTKVVYYVRNEGGNAVNTKVGKQGRKRTGKKLVELRRGERKSEELHDVAYLKDRLTELMQLHRTPDVVEQIENVKELLRLATSLSVEASIEAAEGTEQIAGELASARAKEIGAELQLTRERLLSEKAAREAAAKELNQGYED